MKKILGSPWLWLVVVLLSAGIPIARSFYREIPRVPGVLGQLPPFELTDQDGEPFGHRQLAGTVWIADFVFLGCSDVCPRLTERMREAQERLSDLKPVVQLVTLSVDPQNDTPARLKEYAKAFGADPEMWTFLTGDAAEVQETVVKGFKIGMGEEVDPLTGIVQIFHGEKLVLVDRKGQIRGYYDAYGEDFERLLEQARVLARTNF